MSLVFLRHYIPHVTTFETYFTVDNWMKRNMKSTGEIGVHKVWCYSFASVFSHLLNDCRRKSSKRNERRKNVWIMFPTFEKRKKIFFILSVLFVNTMRMWRGCFVSKKHVLSEKAGNGGCKLINQWMSVVSHCPSVRETALGAGGAIE